MKILFIGAQGCGKSTQAKLLSKFLKIPLISTGEIFRQMADVNQMVKRILDEGRLMDDNTTSNLVKDRLQEKDCQNGFIIDGYPRNLGQLKLLDPKFDIVFYLDVPREQVIERLTKRGREDDTPESISLRLDLFNKQTKPLLDYYGNLDTLVEIDGEGEVNKIQDRIRIALEKKFG